MITVWKRTVGIKKAAILILIFFSIVLNACDSEEWEEIEESNQYNIITTFMEGYYDSWEKSLENHTYSIMESYFIANSHVYHMQRRNHQQLITERKVESLLSFSEITLEKNEFGDLRITGTELIEVRQADEILMEERKRSYYLTEVNQGLRITKIERRE
ncbi:TcaA NTF2-like domain-containing protein [Evansella tamaricis]|uniref:TcaA protein NTF2-like domain-containing protein n=1 Tax=Evansella tamaricis TaxID=2069301 RepID=A0ABS6JLV6_9BACI|nr:hypothetical protein [Evansella tamaricis]MBU9714642.1 hypothetical protein [Evansella tamaricis]